MDSKYGRLFTTNDVEKIFDWLDDQGEGQPLIFEEVLERMEEEGTRFKFPEDEPLFTLRGRDKRALGAVRYYRDHQSPSVPPNHIENMERAVKVFDEYRSNHPELMKEPD